MQYIRPGKKVEVEKLRLPKNFEFKVLGKIVSDLETTANETTFSSNISNSLQNDFRIVKQAIRNRDIKAIVRLASSLGTQGMLTNREISCRSDALAFFLQYQLSCFLKKYPFKGIDTKKTAIDKFLMAESTCARFNKINHKALLSMNDTAHPILGGMIESLRADILFLLGDVPNIERVETSALHGPGMSAASDTDRGCTTSYYKWSSLPYSITASAVPYAREAISNDPRWIGALDHWYRSRCNNYYAPIDVEDFWRRIFKVIDGSRITTVPKSALTDRTIAIEPLMNVYLQLGVDRLIKRRLQKCWHIDLSDQHWNQTLAKKGSETGLYATIDLSAASDTISLKICEMLLPPAWYNLLLDLRSPKGELQGIKCSFDKISSMGNGFTFALESLIFASLVRHVRRRKLNHSEYAVYGDDIIISSDCAKDLIEALEYCGFSINTDKSFTSGPFRESCGTDWFLGFNVRPVFLKRRIRDARDLFYVHNSLSLLESNLFWAWGIHFKTTRQYLRTFIPKRYKRIFGPPSELLDGYLFSSRKVLGVKNNRWHLALIPVANVFNHNTGFLFRKLMASLKKAITPYRWDKNRSLTTGNSFDVTKRDSVHYRCTKMKVFI
jgi:hypothetical protein